MELKQLSKEEFESSPNGIQFITVREKLNIAVPDHIYELAMKEHPKYFK